MGVPKTTLRLGDLLGGLRALSKLYSCLWFIAVKGYEAKSAKRKGTWDKVLMKPGINFPESSSRGVTQDVLKSPSNELWQHMLNHTFLPGKLIEILCPGFYWGWLCRHPLPNMYQNTTPRREARIPHKPYCLHKLFKHIETFLSGNRGTFLKPKVLVKRSTCKWV